MCVNNKRILNSSIYSLYVLRLMSEKFYIGKSQNIEKRISDHFINRGAEWTKLYKPLEVIEIIKNVDNFEEDKKVKQYMLKYGIESVRGGTYSKINLSKNEIFFIKKELYTAMDMCFNCGSTEHFISKCDKK
jgi:predicted GIY-YIG superfamily endonuclease